MMSLPVWVPGPMFLLGGLCPWSHVPSRVQVQGVTMCVWGVSVVILTKLFLSSSLKTVFHPLPFQQWPYT